MTSKNQDDPRRVAVPAAGPRAAWPHTHGCSGLRARLAIDAAGMTAADRGGCSRPEPCEVDEDLFALAYTLLVRLYANVAWTGGRAEGLLAVLDAVSVASDVPPVSASLRDRLTAVFDDPYEQYRVQVDQAASALWHHHAAPCLLTALHTWARTSGLCTTGSVLRAPHRRNRPR